MNTTRRSVLAGVALMVGIALTAQAQISTTDLKLWLKADAGVEEAPGDLAETGDAVSRWLDQSGLGNHASLAGTAPTFQTGQIAGNPALNFDVGSDRLQLATPLVTGTTDYSIFAVVRAPSWSGEHVIGSNFGGGGYPNTSGLEFYGASSSFLAIYQSGSVSGPGLTADKVFLVQADRSGSNVRLRINDTIVADTTLTAVSIDSPLGWTIGSGANYDTVLGFGDMPENIVYTRSLEANQSDRSLAVEYLFAKYSIPEPSVAALAGLGLLAWWRARHIS